MRTIPLIIQTFRVIRFVRTKYMYTITRRACFAFTFIILLCVVFIVAARLPFISFSTHDTAFMLNHGTDLPIATRPHEILKSRIFTPGCLVTTNETTDEAMWTDANVRNRFVGSHPASRVPDIDLSDGTILDRTRTERGRCKFLSRECGEVWPIPNSANVWGDTELRVTLSTKAKDSTVDEQRSNG